MKKIHMTFFLVLLSSIMVKGQENPNHQIRISEERLTALVDKIVTARQNQLMQAQYLATTNVASTSAYQEKRDLQSELQIQKINHLEKMLKKFQQKRTANTSSNQQNNTVSDNDLLALQNEIDLLRMTVIQKTKQPKQDPVVIVPQTNSSEANSAQKIADTERTKTLEKQMDSIQILLLEKTKQPVVNTGKDYSDDMDDLRKRINAIKEDINSKQSESVEIDQGLSELKYFKKTIYFDNNSKEIKANYTSDLRAIQNTLETYSNVDILINGFASKKGNPIYNESLSMQRTEAVKQWLMAQSIHPIRILTSYHGIDYTKGSEAEARRVEIKYIIRN